MEESATSYLDLHFHLENVEADADSHANSNSDSNGVVRRPLERNLSVNRDSRAFSEDEEMDEVKQVGMLAESSATDVCLLPKKSVTIAENIAKSVAQVDEAEPERKLVLPVTQARLDNTDCALDRTPVHDARGVESNVAVWKMNYREAAIYLTEGDRNDPLSAHPSNRSKLQYYFITHNAFFSGFLLTVAMLNMALAMVEGPGTPVFNLSNAAKVSAELFFLTVFFIELIIRYQWMGRYSFLQNRRTLLKTVIIVALLIELTVYYSVNATYGRYIRAFRPLFVIDNHHSRNQRRFIRQVIGSLNPVVNMVFLLVFNMTLFTLLGYYLFCTVPNNTFFETLQASFISLFVLLTTANFPDVMMPAYAHNRASVLFFIVYLCIELYLLMNLVFAVVYNKFSQSQIEKLKKLYIQRTKAAEFAFDLLTTKANPGYVTYHHFEGMMRYYRPKMSRFQIYLTFKALDDSGSGHLSLKEFCHIYETSRYVWKLEVDRRPWWNSLHGSHKKLMKFLFHAVQSRIFTFLIYVAIITNTVLIVVDAVKPNSGQGDALYQLDYNFAELAFAILYAIEAILKIISLGPTAYFHSSWHAFDFSVTVLILLGQVIDMITKKFPYSIFLRPFRLMRLLKVKKLYREVLSTMFTLSDRFGSVLAVVVHVYYFYAIIGIGVFGGAPMLNCCSGGVADYYRNGTGYYYLNNFDNVLNSAVTLFELTVVNNWYVIMEAYVQMFSEWARVFFMLFYLSMMILINMVLSFILGAFMFRMQYKQHHVGDTIEDRAWVYEQVEVNNLEKSIFDTPFEVRLRKKPLKRLRRFVRRRSRRASKSPAATPAPKEEEHESASVLRRLASVDIADPPPVSEGGIDTKDVELEQVGQVTLDETGTMIKYKGTRKKLQFEFNLEMHESDLKTWLNEERFVANLKCAMRRNSSAVSNQSKQSPKKSLNPIWARASYWKAVPSRITSSAWKKLLWLFELDKQEVEGIDNMDDSVSVPQTADVWRDGQTPQFPRDVTVEMLVETESLSRSSSIPKSILKQDSEPVIKRSPSNLQSASPSAGDNGSSVTGGGPARKSFGSMMPAMPRSASTASTTNKEPKLAQVLALAMEQLSQEDSQRAPVQLQLQPIGIGQEAGTEGVVVFVSGTDSN